MKKIINLLSVIFIICVCSSKEAQLNEITQNPWDITLHTMISDMKAGWNLGNTFDAAVPGREETNWGNPVTTRDMITKIKEAGFNLIRLPISYGRMVDSDLRIPESFLARYKEVVDYCIDNGMYVIINSHHDNEPNSQYSNFYDMATEYTQHTETFTNSIWTQIAEYFKDYDYHLIFEGFNEPQAKNGETISGFTSNTWWYDPSNLASLKTIINLNNANQQFVNTVRATGGNNKKRYLLVPGIGASAGYVMANEFSIPSDNSGFENLIMVSVHSYSPIDMGITDKHQKEFLPENKTEITNMFNGLAHKFTQKGIGVIIGEWGTSNLNNTDQRVAHAKYYVSQAAKNGIVCVWWDNGYEDVGHENFCIFNRKSLTWKYPALVDAIINSADIKKVD